VHIVRADTGIIITLPLAPTDPWPGPIGVAVAIPSVLLLAIAFAAVGGLGEWAPWVVGAAPMVSLFVPLLWIVRRSRGHHATLVLDALGLRVVHNGRAPAFRADKLRSAVAWDSLAVEDDDQRVELKLEPLDGDEIRTLRAVLRDLTR